MRSHVKKGIILLFLLLFCTTFFVSCDNPFFGRRGSEEPEPEPPPSQPYDGGNGNGGRRNENPRSRVIPKTNPSERGEDEKGGDNYSLVTFFADGGDPEPKQQRILEGGYVKKVEAMIKDGFGFGGWFTDPGFSPTNEWDFSKDTVTKADLNLYAKWEAPPFYIIKFDADSGTPPPEDQNILSGAKVVEPLPMRRTGYGFEGWFNQDDHMEWDFSDPVTSDLTLYAKWSTTYFTVRFETNGGSPAPASQFLVSGSRVIEPLAMVAREGLAFEGWFDTSTGDRWEFATDTVSGNVTLEARWVTAQYRISFIDQYGHLGNFASLPIDYGSTYLWGDDHIPDRTDFGFAGWFSATGYEWDFSTDKVTGNIALLAKWVAEEQDMSWVTMGSYRMGSEPNTGNSNERPAHNVYLRGFFMSENLVTQLEYSTVMLGRAPTDAELFNKSINPSNFGAQGIDRADKEVLPVECVSWYDAIRYCNLLSMMSTPKLDPVYMINGSYDPADWPAIPRNTSDNSTAWDTLTMNLNNNGYRLPTEAEWEFAARGRGDPLYDFTYSGEDLNPDLVAWYGNVGGTSGGMTHEVGKLKPNNLGIYDMSGNVYEWCWDWWGSYSANDQSNPTGPASGSQRVRRGGCWSNTADNVRAKARANFVPSNHTYVMGIRVVRYPSLAEIDVVVH